MPSRRELAVLFRVGQSLFRDGSRNGRLFFSNGESRNDRLGMLERRSIDMLFRRGGSEGGTIGDRGGLLRARFGDRGLWCACLVGVGRGSRGGRLGCLLTFGVGCGRDAWCGGLR